MKKRVLKAVARIKSAIKKRGKLHLAKQQRFRANMERSFFQKVSGFCRRMKPEYFFGMPDFFPGLLKEKLMVFVKALSKAKNESGTAIFELPDSPYGRDAQIIVSARKSGGAYTMSISIEIYGHTKFETETYYAM